MQSSTAQISSKLKESQISNIITHKFKISQLLTSNSYCQNETENNSRQ